MKIIYAVIPTLFLAACGGGGGSSSTESAPPVTKHLFAANNGSDGNELWITDGTESGTTMVKDINPGGDSSPEFIIKLNGTYYFAAQAANNSGKSLWKSNGTESGTVQIATAGIEDISLLLAAGDKIFIKGSANKQPLIAVTDGTEAGTTVLGTGKFAGFNFLQIFNNELYFSAFTQATGYELWKSDGTEAGTVIVKDITPGTQGGNPYLITSIDEYLYFSSPQNYDPALPAPSPLPTGKGLWRTDGTEAGTTFIKAVAPGNPNAFIKYKDAIYFSGDGGTNGYELWKTDGTAAGTELVKDIQPGGVTSSSAINDFTIVNDQLFFLADNGVAGASQLWVTDGTAAGTKQVNNTGSSGIKLDNLTNLDQSLVSYKGQLYLKAQGDPAVMDVGYELWTYTNNDFALVKDINPGDASSSLLNFAFWVISFNGGTNTYPDYLLANDGSVLFGAKTDSNGYELWKSNGTEAGTVMVKDINPDAGSGLNPPF